MDLITTEFQKKEQNNRSKDHRKNCGLEEQVQLREGESEGEKKKGKFVPSEVLDKRKVEARCMKYRRSNHQQRDYKASLGAKPPLFPDNAN